MISRRSVIATRISRACAVAALVVSFASALAQPQAMRVIPNRPSYELSSKSPEVMLPAYCYQEFASPPGTSNYYVIASSGIQAKKNGSAVTSVSSLFASSASSANPISIVGQGRAVGLTMRLTNPNDPNTYELQFPANGSGILAPSADILREVQRIYTRRASDLERDTAELISAFPNGPERDEFILVRGWADARRPSLDVRPISFHAKQSLVEALGDDDLQTGRPGYLIDPRTVTLERRLLILRDGKPYSLVQAKLLARLFELSSKELQRPVSLIQYANQQSVDSTEESAVIGAELGSVRSTGDIFVVGEHFMSRGSNGERGQGDGHVFYLGAEEAIVIDTMASRFQASRMIAHLKASGVRRITLIYTHPDRDHISQLEYVLRSEIGGLITQVIIGSTAKWEVEALSDIVDENGVRMPSSLMEALSEFITGPCHDLGRHFLQFVRPRSVAMSFTKVGTSGGCSAWTAQVASKCKIEIVRFEEFGEVANRGSLVTRITNDGISYLQTGDIDFDAMGALSANPLIRPFLKANIVKWPHHRTGLPRTNRQKEQFNSFLLQTDPDEIDVSNWGLNQRLGQVPSFIDYVKDVLNRYVPFRDFLTGHRKTAFED